LFQVFFVEGMAGRTRKVVSSSEEEEHIEHDDKAQESKSPMRPKRTPPKEKAERRDILEQIRAKR